MEEEEEEADAAVAAAGVLTDAARTVTLGEAAAMLLACFVASAVAPAVLIRAVESEEETEEEREREEARERVGGTAQQSGERRASSSGFVAAAFVAIPFVSSLASAVMSHCCGGYDCLLSVSMVLPLGECTTTLVPCVFFVPPTGLLFGEGGAVLHVLAAGVPDGEAEGVASHPPCNCVPR